MAAIGKKRTFVCYEFRDVIVTVRSVVVVFVAVTLMVSATSQAFAQHRHRYIALGFDRLSLDFDPKAQLLTGHTVSEKLELCSRNDQFFCVQSEKFNFAVPSKVVWSSLSKWQYAGFEYVGMPLNEPFRFLGNDITVMQIDSINQTPNMRFFYSSRQGLIAFKLLENSAPVFFSAEKCGILSPRSCSALKK